MTNPTPWAPLYAGELRAAAAAFALDPLVLLAIAWQESHGGVVQEVGRWHWGPARIYRYEPGFWDSYMGPSSKSWPKYRPPSMHPAVVEAWKRRVSSSYGIAQVMFATAEERGFTGNPEQLFDPATSAHFGAKHLRHLLDGKAKGDLRDALAAYNTGRARDELTTYDDEVLARFAKLRAYADTGADPFGG